MRITPALLLGAAALSAACSGSAPSEAPAAEAKPATIVLDVFGPRLLVTNETSGDLTVMDLARNTVTATIPLGKRPRGIVVGPDGRTAY